MSAQAIFCQTIRECRLLQFNYDGETRVVEPHQLAYNKKDNIALSAYWVHGYSESGDTSNRWRDYLVDKLSAIVVLDEHFSGPRPDYKRTPNKNYHSAICEL
jgi:predicted DNA-binding transcriptional regulator YafY